MKKALLLDKKDNVATILKDLKKGTKILVNMDKTKLVEVTLKEDILMGHKFAICDINQKDKVFKYGEAIGRASTDIKIGSWVHVHNLESNRGRGDKIKGRRCKNV